MEGLIPPFLLIPLLAVQTGFGSGLPLLPGFILEPSGWAAGWLCHCHREVTARSSSRFRSGCRGTRRVSPPSWVGLGGLAKAEGLCSSLGWDHRCDTPDLSHSSW